ncbi:MAG: extracellular solute-binding protein [Xanthobacteraceae bacterium]
MRLGSTVALTIAGLAGAIAIAVLHVPVRAQNAPPPTWIVPELLTAAKAEGKLTVYGSMNEAEALPFWKSFQDATGVQVNYVRSSDTQIMARVAIENRVRQRTWDLALTTTVTSFPHEYLAPYDPPEAKGLMDGARPSDQRWYGAYANYNAPAYNSKFVKQADLPKSYDDFAAHKDWAGKTAIVGTDAEWVAAMFSHYGEGRARTLIKNIAGTLNPVLTDGHLALARSVGSGEYWVALNNFLNLTINVKMSGAPSDYWLLNPVVLIFGAVGINVLAPHPNAAKLAENFVLSHEAQILVTRKGRFPTRPEVPTNPPEIGALLKPMKIVPVVFDGTEHRKWQKIFNELFGRG